MNSVQKKVIYFISGTSGVGKTTLVDQLKKKYFKKPWAFIHFDAIGVPSLAEMEREYATPAAWQKAKTFEWIDRLMQAYDHKKIFMEGQVDLTFIHEAFAKHHFRNYRIILLDCSEQEMAYRLTFSRAQRELFTKAMRNWLQYLRRQAKASNTTIIDSSHLSPEEMLEVFERAVTLR